MRNFILCKYKGAVLFLKQLRYYKNKKIFARFTVINIISMIIIVIILITSGFLIIRNISMEASERIAKIYALEAIDKFNIHVRHDLMRLGLLSSSAAVQEWLSDEGNLEKKQAAFDVLTRYAASLENRAIYVAINDSFNEYFLEYNIQFTDFLPFSQLTHDDPLDQRFFNTIGCENEFNFSIGINKMFNTWNVWINHQIIHNGRIVGIIASFFNIENIHHTMFRHFDSESTTGYIVDGRGYIHIDSSFYMHYIDFLGETPHISSIYFVLGDAVEKILLKYNNFFHEGVLPQVLNISRYFYDIATIVPIPNSSFLMIVLFNSDALLTIRNFTPLIFLLVLLLVFYLIILFNSAKRYLIMPLTKLTESVSLLNESGTENVSIYGTTRKDEIGNLAKTIKYMWILVMSAEKTAKERLSVMINSSPLACCLLDESLTEIDCNMATVELLELKNKSEYKKHFYELIPEYQPDGTNSRLKMKKYINEALNKGEANFEWMYQTLDGNVIPCNVVFKGMIIEGKPMIVGYLSDLRNVYKLREIKNRMQIMLDASPLIIEYWDQDHNILDCNKTALDFYGYAAKEDYFKNKKNNFYSPETWKEMLDKIFEYGSYKFEILDKTKDGDDVFFDVEGICFNQDEKRVVITYSQDVTQIKKLHKEQKRAEIAEESSRAKSVFLANMSHEIRTPMNSILGFSELALEMEACEQTREYISKIVINAKWLLDIINDVLDISKIESGNLELEEIPFNIKQLMEDCCLLMNVLAQKKDIALTFNASNLENLNKNLLGDPTKLRQIFTNLLSNAIKFTEKGSVSVNAEILESNKNNCIINFEIKDTGIGITKEQISKIFETFTQGDSSTTRKYGGTGLGLTITRQFIEAMNGELLVESIPQLGSKFSFAIKFKTVDSAHKSSYPGEDENEEIKRPHFDKGDILVVDDNEMNLDVANDLLKRVGLNISIAKDGREAVDIVTKRMKEGRFFDLIFMDVHMPIMDGKAAAGIIRGLCITPIIALTAEIFGIKDENPYKDYGMDGYLSKPLIQRKLWACLLKYLEPEKENKKKDDLYEDKVLLEKLKTKFAQTNQETIKKLREALEQGNFKQAYIIVHTLKSSAAMIGEMELSKIAKEAEYKLKTNETSLEAEILDKLEEGLKLVLRGLSNYGNL